MKIKNFFIVFLGLTTCFFCLATSSFPQEKASFQGTINKVYLGVSLDKSSKIKELIVIFNIENQPKKMFIIPFRDFEKYIQKKLNTKGAEKTSEAARKELVGKKVSLDAKKVSLEGRIALIGNCSGWSGSKVFEYYEVTDFKLQ